MKEILECIKYLQGRITSNLRELDGDVTSDYAKFTLNENKHYQTAIEVMINIVDPTHGYAE